MWGLECRCGCRCVGVGVGEIVGVIVHHIKYICVVFGVNESMCMSVLYMHWTAYTVSGTGMYMK